MSPIFTCLLFWRTEWYLNLGLFLKYEMCEIVYQNKSTYYINSSIYVMEIIIKLVFQIHHAVLNLSWKLDSQVHVVVIFIKK